MDVRDKLLFEPEYGGSLRESIPPKSSLWIPWSWLPGALCLLQEVLLAFPPVSPFLMFLSVQFFLSILTFAC